MLPEKFGGAYSRWVVGQSRMSWIRVQLKTSLFEVGFEKYFTEIITILGQHVTRNINECYLEGQGHSMTLQQNRVRPITLLFQ